VLALLERLNADLKDAMRARDAERTSVLRMLLARVKEKQVAGEARAALSEEQVEQVFTTFAKQRRESAEAFAQAGRTDLHDKETRELKIVLAYLPERMGEAEMRAIVQGIIAETGASTARDLGRVMGAAMQRLRGRADGAQVQALVRELLGA